MIPPANNIAFDVRDEPGAAVLRKVKGRLLLWQAANWLAPLIGIPVMTLLLLFNGINEVGFYGLAAFFLGTIGYCAYLHAQLNSKRHARDPETQRGKMIWDGVGYFILQSILTCIATYLPLAFIASSMSCC